MTSQLTDEDETLLANIIEQARDRAKAAWKSSDTFNQAANDGAFDGGFEAAMDFALSDEFLRFISQLKSMLDGGPSHH